MLNVQFTDASKTAILSYFGAPQNPANYPNLGTVATTDARWHTFYAAQPIFVQANLPTPT